MFTSPIRIDPNRVLLIASFEGCPRVWKMASALSERSFNVTVLEWDRSARLPASEKVLEIDVRRMKWSASYGSKLILFLPIWWIYISIFLVLNRFDVIQPQNLDNLFPIWLFSKIRRSRIVYDIADFYADSYIPVGMTRLRQVVAWLERLLIANVDSAIIADKSRLRQIGMPSQYFSIIYNSPPDRYSEPKRKSIINPSNPKLVLFYGGVLEAGRGLNLMVNAVRNIPKVKLLIAGFGQFDQELSMLVKNVSNVEFLGRVPYDVVIDSTFASDCLIALYDPSIPNNMFASPNKLFEAMMCARPIIVSNGTTMAKIVAQEHCGFVVTYGDINALRSLVTYLANNKRSLANYGQNGRRAYEEKYSWKSMVTALIDLYGRLK
jgi:glycosyltransferase involved in cell wall biosynthesis